MKTITQQRIILAIFAVISSNFAYNLADSRYYFTRNNMPIVDLIVIIGAALTIIIEFYGTYLIIEKHILKGDN